MPSPRPQQIDQLVPAEVRQYVEAHRAEVDTEIDNLRSIINTQGRSLRLVKEELTVLLSEVHSRLKSVEDDNEQLRRLGSRGGRVRGE